METLIIENKNLIHVGLFLVGLLILFFFEIFTPRRSFQFPRGLRIFSNLSLAAINNLVLYLTFPILAVGAGFMVVNNGWGLFQHVGWPGWLEFVLGILLLDLLIYGQHVAFHLIPPLWRLHRVHHADLELDVTSGIRFHPVEIIISMGLKIGFISVLGTGPLTVFVFELILMSSSMFNHANLNIPLGIDKVIRLLIITPDMHRVHHSIYKTETNSNYGFNFPWWDRLFRTYNAQPKDGHMKMLIGIDLFRSKRWLHLHRLLIEPFVNRKD